MFSYPNDIRESYKGRYDWQYGMYVENNRSTQTVSWKTLQGRYHSGDLVVYVRIILKFEEIEYEAVN
jgi:hypothetical protein